MLSSVQMCKRISIIHGIWHYQDQSCFLLLLWMCLITEAASIAAGHDNSNDDRMHSGMGWLP